MMNLGLGGFSTYDPRTASYGEMGGASEIPGMLPGYDPASARMKGTPQKKKDWKGGLKKGLAGLAAAAEFEPVDYTQGMPAVRPFQTMQGLLR